LQASWRFLTNQLGEYPGHLQEGTARRGGCIDLLLVQIDTDVLLAQLVYELDQAYVMARTRAADDLRSVNAQIEFLLRQAASKRKNAPAKDR